MSILPIVIAPDPRLKSKSRLVDTVDSKIQTLMDDMLETMYAEPGIGLAAPQVGVNLRVIVVDVSKSGEVRQPIRMVNPEIIWCSDIDHCQEEGCLSFPNQFAKVIRPEEIKVTYLNESNNIKELNAGGMLATCIQHEIDHLDGILFVDHISSLKRNMILRKLMKYKKSLMD